MQNYLILLPLSITGTGLTTKSILFPNSPLKFTTFQSEAGYLGAHSINLCLEMMFPIHDFQNTDYYHSSASTSVS